MKVVENRKREFLKVPGLLQKYYVRDKQTGELAGVYLWESLQAVQGFKDSELAKSIPTAYKWIGLRESRYSRWLTNSDRPKSIHQK